MSISRANNCFVTTEMVNPDPGVFLSTVMITFEWNFVCLTVSFPACVSGVNHRGVCRFVDVH